MSRERDRIESPSDSLALGVILVLYGLLAWSFWFLSDDAFISFRYARNWAEGYGLRYNLGDAPPVEGYSNFLWVAVCAVIERLGADPAFWAPALSLASGALLLAVVFRALRRALGARRMPAVAATMTLGLFPPFAVWATGGLETMPFALALFVTFDRLILRERPATVTAGLAGLATSLLRIEGLAWALLVGVLALLGALGDRRKTRSLATYFVVLLSGFAVYFLARYRYYGTPFPNPVYLKVAFGSDVLLRGYRYVALFFLTFLTPFLVVPAGLAALVKGPLRPAAATLAMALAVPAYAVVVGGDWMTMGRFLVPGLAFQALLVGWLLNRVAEGGVVRRAAALALAATTLAVALLPTFDVHLVPRSVRLRYRYMYSHPGFRSQVEEWREHREGVAYASEIGRALARNARPGESIVVGAIGAIGYYSGLHIYDRFGLVSREVAAWARREGRPESLRSPGHDFKVSRGFFLDEHPTYLLFDVIDSRAMRSRVLGQARAWREIDQLWRRYAPDFFPLDGKSDSETHRVLMVFRAIEDEVDVSDMERPERRRLREEKADEMWEAFYRRAEKLPELES